MFYKEIYQPIVSDYDRDGDNVVDGSQSGTANVNTMFDELRYTMQVVKDYCAERNCNITEMATAGGCHAMLLRI